jgi:hypothetical protein
LHEFTVPDRTGPWGTACATPRGIARTARSGTTTTRPEVWTGVCALRRAARTVQH